MNKIAVLYRSDGLKNWLVLGKGADARTSGEVGSLSGWQSHAFCPAKVISCIYVARRTSARKIGR